MRGIKLAIPQLNFKNFHKRPIKGIISNTFISQLHHGQYGLKVLQHGFLTIKQLELSRRMLVKFVGKRRQRKRARVWRRIYSIQPLTAKPRGVRMGQGKGAPSYWGIFIRPGNILYEIPKRVKRGRTAISAMVILKKMLPIKTKVITKNYSRQSSDDRNLKTLDLKKFMALYKYLYKKFY